MQSVYYYQCVSSEMLDKIKYYSNKRFAVFIKRNNFYYEDTYISVIDFLYKRFFLSYAILVDGGTQYFCGSKINM